MRVAILTPEWDRDCKVCEKYVPRSDGSFVIDRRTSLPMLRQGNHLTPCHKCAKVPVVLRRQGAEQEELRAAAVELTAQNRKAWEFYQACRAVNHWPDDPIVRWAAVILRRVEDECERLPMARLVVGLGELIERLRKGRG